MLLEENKDIKHKSYLDSSKEKEKKLKISDIEKISVFCKFDKVVEINCQRNYILSFEFSFNYKEIFNTFYQNLEKVISNKNFNIFSKDYELNSIASNFKNLKIEIIKNEIIEEDKITVIEIFLPFQASSSESQSNNYTIPQFSFCRVKKNEDNYTWRPKKFNPNIKKIIKTNNENFSIYRNNKKRKTIEKICVSQTDVDNRLSPTKPGERINVNIKIKKENSKKKMKINKCQSNECLDINKKPYEIHENYNSTSNCLSKTNKNRKNTDVIEEINLEEEKKNMEIIDESNKINKVFGDFKKVYKKTLLTSLHNILHHKYVINYCKVSMDEKDEDEEMPSFLKNQYRFPKILSLFSQNVKKTKLSKNERKIHRLPSNIFFKYMKK